MFLRVLGTSILESDWGKRVGEEGDLKGICMGGRRWGGEIERHKCMCRGGGSLIPRPSEIGGGEGLVHIVCACV